jgi:2-isopropylmalate synthase
MFWREYVERVSPWRLGNFRTYSEDGRVNCQGTLYFKDVQTGINGNGNGPLAALVNGICQLPNAPRFEINNYSEHALSSGETAAAIAYIQIKTVDGKSRWGAGVDTNIELASVRAVLSALNRV